MDETLISLKLILEQAGIDRISLDSFSQRFNIQKRIYLVQLMGLDLGYRFGWYLRGPYCTDLTSHAYALKEEIGMGAGDFTGRRLSDTAMERISRANRLWQPPAGISVSPDQWLELLASVHYLKHIAYWPKETSRDLEAVFAALVKAKPHFKNSKADVQRAWEKLDEFGLIRSKKLA